MDDVSAADLSPDDTRLAVAKLGGNIELLDTATLQPAPESPDSKSSLTTPDASADTRYLLLLFSSDGKELAATTMKEPARLWTLRDGTMRLLKPRAQADQIMRVAFRTIRDSDCAPALPAQAGIRMGWSACGIPTRLDQAS